MVILRDLSGVSGEGDVRALRRRAQPLPRPVVPATPQPAEYQDSVVLGCELPLQETQEPTPELLSVEAESVPEQPDISDLAQAVIQDAMAEAPEAEQAVLSDVLELVARLQARAAEQQASGELECASETTDVIDLLGRAVLSFSETLADQPLRRRYLDGLRELSLGVQAQASGIDLDEPHIAAGLSHLVRGQAFEAFREMRATARELTVLPRSVRREFDQFIESQYSRLQRCQADSVQTRQIIDDVNTRYLELQREACLAQFDQVGERFTRFAGMRSGSERWQTLVANGQAYLTAARRFFEAGAIEDGLAVFQHAAEVLSASQLIDQAQGALTAIGELVNGLPSEGFEAQRAQVTRALGQIEGVIYSAYRGGDPAELGQRYNRAVGQVSEAADQVNVELERQRAEQMAEIEAAQREHVLSRLDAIVEVLRGIEADRGSLTAAAGRATVRVLASPLAGLNGQLDNYLSVVTDGAAGEATPELSLADRALQMFASITGGGYVAAVRQDIEAQERDRQGAVDVGGVSADNLSELIHTLERYRGRVEAGTAGTFEEQVRYLDQVLASHGREVTTHPAIEQAMREIQLLPTMARGVGEMAAHFFIPFYQTYTEYRTTGTVRASTVAVDAVMAPFQLMLVGGMVRGGVRMSLVAGRAVSSALGAARLARLSRLGAIVPAVVETETAITTSGRVAAVFSRGLEMGRGTLGLANTGSVFAAPAVFSFQAYDQYEVQMDQYRRGARANAPELPYVAMGTAVLAGVVMARFGGQALSGGRLSALRIRYAAAPTEALATRLRELQLGVVERASRVAAARGEALTADGATDLRLLESEAEELRTLLTVARERGLMPGPRQAELDDFLQGVSESARSDLRIGGYEGLRGRLRGLLERYNSEPTVVSTTPIHERPTLILDTLPRGEPLVAEPSARPGAVTMQEGMSRRVVEEPVSMDPLPSGSRTHDQEAIAEIEQLMARDVSGQAEIAAEMQRLGVEPTPENILRYYDDLAFSRGVSRSEFLFELRRIHIDFQVRMHGGSAFPPRPVSQPLLPVQPLPTYDQQAITELERLLERNLPGQAEVAQALAARGEGMTPASLLGEETYDFIQFTPELRNTSFGDRFTQLAIRRRARLQQGPRIRGLEPLADEPFMPVGDGPATRAGRPPQPGQPARFPDGDFQVQPDRVVPAPQPQGEDLVPGRLPRLVDEEI
jgi:hypothetical protein